MCISDQLCIIEAVARLHIITRMPSSAHSHRQTQTHTDRHKHIHNHCQPRTRAHTLTSTDSRVRVRTHIHTNTHTHKLQALVYNILPSTTAVFSYAIASRKLSANEQFFVGAQTVVSLLQTTQIKQGVSFIAANKVYTSTYKTRESRRNSFFYPGGCVSRLRACFGVRLLLQSY